jgi:glycerol-3-phosphate O-acyltransferase
VALNYDRVMEDKTLIDAHVTGTRRFRFSLRPIWRYLRRQLWNRITGRYHRYGYAAVSFGEPLSLSSFLETSHADAAADLGAELMGRIATVMPVTPVPLVAHALQDGVRSTVALDALLRRRIDAAKARGVTIHIPRDDIAYTIEAGLRALIERRVLRRTGDQLTLSDTRQAADLLAFYAASVAHLLDETRQTAAPRPSRKATAT